jgi:hypothetical protein
MKLERSFFLTGLVWEDFEISVDRDTDQSSPTSIRSSTPILPGNSEYMSVAIEHLKTITLAWKWKIFAGCV